MGLTRMRVAVFNGGFSLMAFSMMLDCIAYDPRPIFGGKVVIQTKRYKP